MPMIKANWTLLSIPVFVNFAFVPPMVSLAFQYFNEDYRSTDAGIEAISKKRLRKLKLITVFKDPKLRFGHSDTNPQVPKLYASPRVHKPGDKTFAPVSNGGISNMTSGRKYESPVRKNA
jgi:hypothetical protein